MKKEIPILFSTPMVQAILAGRKTMTRRDNGLHFVNKSPVAWKFNRMSLDSKGQFNAHLESLPGFFDSYCISHIQCPYGKPGDILWLRETYVKACLSEDGGGPAKGEQWRYWYKADNDSTKEGWHHPDKDGPQPGPRWTPSIHMPKVAARIWLEVTDVRVERLQEISEEDAKAEGVQRNCEGVLAKCPACTDECKAKDEWFHYTRDLDDFPAFNAKESFESLWHSINGAESWEANPWVWVVSFKVLSTTGKPEPLTEKA